MSKLVVVALGGNALLRSNQKGTYNEQIENVTDTCEALMSFIKNGDNLIIGHGNGPQVGNVMLQHEAGAKMFEKMIREMPVLSLASFGMMSVDDVQKLLDQIN